MNIFARNRDRDIYFAARYINRRKLNHIKMKLGVVDLPRYEDSRLLNKMMQSRFGVRKSLSLARDGGKYRGIWLSKGVTVREWKAYKRAKLLMLKLSPLPQAV